MSAERLRAVLLQYGFDMAGVSDKSLELAAAIIREGYVDPPRLLHGRSHGDSAPAPQG